MKQKHIIAALFISVAIFSALSGKAQREKRADSLICDETEYRSAKTSFIIKTSNQKVFDQLKAKYESEFKSYLVRYVYDRHGKSLEYIITFYNDREKEITDFLTD